MIGGLVLHDGHHALAMHLARVDDNERISIRTHGLSADTIADAIAELRLMALGCRTGKPLIHSWASPSKTYSDADWERHREAFEAEFGLVGFPCLEVFHKKYGDGGRTAAHVHRVYLRIDLDGRAVSVSHCAPRQEKISRIAEFMAGERFTSGVFNSAIIARFRDEGRPEIADAMVQAGLGSKNAVPAPSSAERAMAQRLQDLAVDEVWRRCATAWRRADTGPAFKAALADSGLRIAQGRKCPVIVSPAGATYPLLRAINNGGERQNGQAIRKAELAARLKGISLPAASDMVRVAGFNAGVFSITNLDRVSVPAPKPSAYPVQDVPSAHDTLRPGSNLTVEQEAALAELDDALQSSAARRAREIRREIEADIIRDVRRSRHEALRQRINAEKGTWNLPGIGLPDWRDLYRADLAGLPAQYGPHLKWVDRLDAERREVTLRSGATLTLAPNRTWTAHSASHEVIPVMIAYARKRGWTRVNVTGKREWQEQLTRAATRAGLVVVGTELQNIVVAEQSHMQQDALVESWRRYRTDLAHASEETRQEALEHFLHVLEQIEPVETEVVRRVSDPSRQKALASDLSRYRRIIESRAPKLAADPRSTGLGPRLG